MSADLGYCDLSFTTHINRERVEQCRRKANQACARCETKLCDVHAEFCADS